MSSPILNRLSGSRVHRVARKPRVSVGRDLVVLIMGPMCGAAHSSLAHISRAPRLARTLKNSNLEPPDG